MMRALGRKQERKSSNGCWLQLNKLIIEKSCPAPYIITKKKPWLGACITTWEELWSRSNIGHWKVLFSSAAFATSLSISKCDWRFRRSCFFFILLCSLLWFSLQKYMKSQVHHLLKRSFTRINTIDFGIVIPYNNQEKVLKFYLL